jgi:membrane protease YdiL (CAAX protease family)
MAVADLQAPGAAIRRGRRDLAYAGLLLGGLAAVVVLRYAASQAGVADPIAAGVAFGIALVALAQVGGAPVAASIALPRPRSIAIGLVGGLFLVGLALLGRALAGAPSLPSVFRADLFPAWALATVLVASGEEAVLRGRLLDRLAGPLGLAAAVGITSLAFALMHVPFYGWRVVPLDLGVGLFLAGLRLASRGLVAPAIAHALADLATWWL